MKFDWKNVNKVTLIKWIGFGLLVILLIIIFLKIIAYIKSLFGGDEEDKVEKNVKNAPDLKPDSSGGTTSDFNPETYSVELYNVLTSPMQLFVNRCEVLKRANTLNDNQLKAVYNDYKKRFDRSLKIDLQEIYGNGCTLKFWENPDDDLIERLIKFGAI